MTEAEQIRAGERMAQFLADETVKAAFAKAESGFVAAWKNAQSTDQREACWHQLQALDAVVTALSAAVGDGQAARRAVEQRAKREAAASRRGQ